MISSSLLKASSPTLLDSHEKVSVVRKLWPLLFYPQLPSLATKPCHTEPGCASVKCGKEGKGLRQISEQCSQHVSGTDTVCMGLYPEGAGSRKAGGGNILIFS